MQSRSLNFLRFEIEFFQLYKYEAQLFLGGKHERSVWAEPDVPSIKPLQLCSSKSVSFWMCPSEHFPLAK